MAFPSTARDGQTHDEFGKKYVYSELSGTWAPAVPLASLSEIRISQQVSQTATASYETAAELPLVGNTAGQMAFVQETNRLYLWSGTGWYNVATITSAAASVSSAASAYTLATDGTPTVLTLTQSGLESPTWSYAVTSGSLGRTATVSQAANVFTITPSTSPRHTGSFGLTFKATDGSNTIVKTSQFTMSNTAPVIGTGPSATYTLAEDGTPTIITLAATDADGHAITWSYEVISGSLGGTTVTNVGPVFTITPSTDTNDAGVFQLRFVASDGAASDTDVAEFTLAFGPDWSLAYTLDNPNPYGTSADDWFGNSVAISGNYAIVGAYRGEGAGGVDREGKAYIFNVTTGALLHTLDNPNGYGTSAGDEFGSSVAIDGNYAIVSAGFEGDISGIPSGKAYIFNVTTGALLHTLDNPNPYGSSTNDGFGGSVSISGNYAIVGAYGEDDTGGTNHQGFAAGTWSGKAYIFNVTTGALLHTLDNPSGYQHSAGDYFGTSVAISGNYAIVGAYGEDDFDGGSSGKAYIFDVTTGLRVHTLDNPNAFGTSQDDYFGISVAISGNYAIVGAILEDEAGGNESSGKAYIFDVTTGLRVHTLDNPNAYDYSWQDGFGAPVAISGNYAIVGVSNEDDSGGTNSGKAYIFDVTTGELLDTLDNPNAYDTSANDRFGWTVAISGNYVIVGARYEDDAGNTDSGKAYIFQTS
jgi:hypothetical protein